MKFFRIDDELIKQIRVVLLEFEKLNPEWRLVSRAIRNELALLPPDCSIEDLNEDLMSGLLRTFDQMFEPDRDHSDEDHSDQGFDLEALLRTCGLRLGDRLN